MTLLNKTRVFFSRLAGPGLGIALLLGSSLAGQAKGPIEIVADNLEVLRDKESARFTGNVVASQQDMELKSQSLTVHYTNVENRPKGSQADASIRRLEANGNVSVTTPMGEAQGQSGQYDPTNGQVIMLGNVVLTRDGNKLSGGRLDMNVNDGEAVLVPSDSGPRVQGRFIQRSASDNGTGVRPVSVVADKLTVDQAKNHAIFSGRVQLQQQETRLDTSVLRINFAETTSSTGTVTQEVRSMDALGQVRVTAPFGTATGKTGRYDLKTADLALNGDVVLVREKNTLKGQSLLMNVNTGVARLTNNKGGTKGGRVRGTFVPENRN